MCGPGGVGKGTITAGLVRELGSVKLSRSWTTRPRRVGESEDAYVFVSRLEFLRAVDDGKFLEWAEYLGNLYGTPAPDPSDGDDLILEIDLQGAQTIKENYPESLVIAIEPPSLGELGVRMRRRGDSEDHVADRLAIAEREIAIARGLADQVVVNEDPGQAVSAVASIISRERSLRRPLT